MKKYQIIYTDPPWSYRDKALAGDRGACCKYSVMDSVDISKLPISQLADDNCALFIWVTMPKLNEVFSLIDSWGFEYKTCAFTWVKKNKQSSGWFMGMGRWTRANAELCLLATKGSPKRVNGGIQSIVVSSIGEHSRKPPEVRDRIVKLMGDLPRIELFARERGELFNEYAGWDVWGNEINSSIDL
jgi:N6-adenosine-specific RNA methylase IME4